MAADGQIRIEVTLDDGQVVSGLADINGQFDKTQKSGDSAFQKLGKSVKVFAAAAAGAALAAGGLVLAIGSIVEASRELNTDLARLQANSDVAGKNFDAMSDSVKKVAAVSGELDSAVETVSNLIQTDFSENQLGEALDYINGAAIRFSDTLNTEGIADGLQETFATGEAIGQFGELLERSGIDLDAFNKGLKTATKNGTETDYVLQTLASTGLGDTYKAYLEGNKAITDYNAAQVDSEVKAAELAKRLTPLATEFLNLKNSLYDVALGNKDLGSVFDEVRGKLGNFINTLVNEGKKALPEFTKSILSRIPELIQTGSDLINKLAQGIDKNLPTLVDKGTKLAKDFSGKVIENLPQLLSAGMNLIGSLIKGIVNNLPKIVETSLSIIKNLVTTLIKNLPQLLKTGLDILLSIIKGLVSGIPKVINFVTTDFIPSIVKTIKSQDWLQLGKDIINGLVNGLKSIDVVGVVKNIANSMITGAKSVLDIHSPSREFKQIGLFTGEGLVIGLNDSSKNVNKAMQNIGNGILKVSKEYQKEYQKLLNDNAKANTKKENDNNAKIAAIQAAAAKKKRSLTQQEINQIAKLRRDASDAALKAEDSANKKYMALVEKAEKEYLNVVKSYVEDKKSLDELTLLEESKIWEQTIELFKKGSAERITAQREYQKTLETIQKNINDVNENFLNRIADADKNYLEQSQKVRDNYVNEFEKAYTKLFNFTSTFEDYAIKFDASGEALIESLQNQVYAIRYFDEYLGKLSVKGLNKDILNELEELGPKALPELVALNSMTSEQLDKYNKLYDEKQGLANKHVTDKLAKLKKDTEVQLRALKTTHEAELSNIKDAWDKEMKAVVGITSTNLSSLQQVGKDAGQSLLNGLKSMESPLKAQAQRMADEIKNTIDSALNIDSSPKNSKTSNSSVKTSSVTPISNPLRNTSLAGTTTASSAANINTTNNVFNNSSGNLEANVNIAPANVILDKRQVGQIIYSEVDKNQYKSSAISAYAQGVNFG